MIRQYEEVRSFLRTELGLSWNQVRYDRRAIETCGNNEMAKTNRWLYAFRTVAIVRYVNAKAHIRPSDPGFDTIEQRELTKHREFLMYHWRNRPRILQAP